MRYAQPSIIEALCEFVFVPGAPWDFTVFGNFANALGGRLPTREQVQVMAVNVRSVADGIEMVREPRLRFLDDARTRLAQVGTNWLSANVLPPYPHWPSFRAFILESLEAYIKAASPSKIERMTLRYIDGITPPIQDKFQLGDWVQAGSPYIPSALRDSSKDALSRLQKQTVGGAEVVSVVLQPDPQGRLSIMLDTEVVLHDLELEPNTIGRRLDELHGRVVDIFEACISDNTRQILQPEAA